VLPLLCDLGKAPNLSKPQFPHLYNDLAYYCIVWFRGTFPALELPQNLGGGGWNLVQYTLTQWGTLYWVCLGVVINGVEAH
jgi:hypothetical protein